jgi:hypothetical protein
MKHLAGYILLMTLLLSAGTTQGRAAPRVYARVESNVSIYPGQTFTYSVVVEEGTPSKIDISPLAKFSPRPAGGGPSVRVVNGRRSMSYMQYYALVAPSEPGAVVLSGVTVIVDGRNYTTNPVEVTVLKPGTTDRMALELTVSERKCYVGQPVVMTVKWTVTAQVQNASFDVPAFTSGDFTIDDLAQLPAAWAKQQAEIHGVPVVVMENRETVNDTEVAIISFSKILIPKRPGRIPVGPVAASAAMATGPSRVLDFFGPIRPTYERFAVQSDPIALEVLPLPETDPPAQFYGLIGSYTISATASPTKVNVGDPITLTIRIGGNPYLKPVRWPELERIPALAQGFKMPSDRSLPVIEDGAKVFTQRFRWRISIRRLATMSWPRRSRSRWRSHLRKYSLPWMSKGPRSGQPGARCRQSEKGSRPTTMAPRP